MSKVYLVPGHGTLKLGHPARQSLSCSPTVCSVPSSSVPIGPGTLKDIPMHIMQPLYYSYTVYSVLNPCVPAHPRAVTDISRKSPNCLPTVYNIPSLTASLWTQRTSQDSSCIIHLHYIVSQGQVFPASIWTLKDTLDSPYISYSI